jgi:hypothetical protein
MKTFKDIIKKDTVRLYNFSTGEFVEELVIKGSVKSKKKNKGYFQAYSSNTKNTYTFYANLYETEVTLCNFKIKI